MFCHFRAGSVVHTQKWLMFPHFKLLRLLACKFHFNFLLITVPFWTAVGVALGCGWIWFCGCRNGDAAVVDAQQEAEAQTQQKRQQQVILPVWHLQNTIPSLSVHHVREGRTVAKTHHNFYAHFKSVLLLSQHRLQMLCPLSHILFKPHW